MVVRPPASKPTPSARCLPGPGPGAGVTGQEAQARSGGGPHQVIELGDHGSGAQTQAWLLSTFPPCRRPCRP